MDYALFSSWRLDFIMRILFDYKYDKHLGASVFVLVSRNNETIKTLFVALKPTTAAG